MNSHLYKLEKEAFVSHLSGGSKYEVIFITTVSALFFWSHGIFVYVFKRIYSNLKKSELSQIFHFISHFVLVEGSILLAFTLTEYSGILIALHLLLCVLCFGINYLVSGEIPFQSSAFTSSDSLALLNVARKPHISAYRANMMISTLIAILAVDFHVFPRRFAKTETFGYSLMDVGVGAFIVSHALVSPLTKSFSSEVHANGPKSFAATFSKMFFNVAPMLLLGSIRFLMVKSVEYQEHVSEYGAHWNFFFTLGTVALFSTFFTPRPPFLPGILSFVIISSYQIWLSFGGLEDFILNAPRVDFFSANKEGIHSSIGYFALYLAGVELGYHINSNRSAEKWRELIVYLASLSSALFFIVILLEMFGISSSRRMVNIAYYMLILSINIAGILAYLIATALLPQPSEGLLFAAINMNQLFAFLVV